MKGSVWSPVVLALFTGLVDVEHPDLDATIAEARSTAIETGQAPTEAK